MIKDTMKEEREAIIRQSLDCGGGCENCTGCQVGGGNPFEWKRPSLCLRFASVGAACH
ncbi:MAG: hypothetical protein LUG99_00735 [Lachnospiraceae bacterium]|nr:hypothetical protein [Lachnospiraceae bacterium]